MKKIGRVLTAMVTPFKENGEMDYEQAKKLALALLDSGSDGLVVGATTGEAPTLSWEEEMRLFKEVKSVVGDRGDVIAYTGSNSTSEAVEATEMAGETGVDACLSVVPYYNRPNQEGIYQHFKAVAGATKLGVIMYNIPSRVVVNMEPETIGRLSQIPNIIGVKEACGNMEHVAKTLNAIGDRKDFYIWSGNDNDTYPIMALGGYGVIGVTTHLTGKQYKNMMELLLAGKVAEAAAIHRYLVPLVNAMFCAPNPAPVKYALNYLGLKVGNPRLPLVEADEKAASIIKETLKKYTIDLPIPGKAAITLKYKRELSDERIFISDFLNFFPPPDKEFTIKTDIAQAKTKMFSEAKVKCPHDEFDKYHIHLAKTKWFKDLDLQLGHTLNFEIEGTNQYCLVKIT